MFKVVALTVLIAISFVSTSAFAETTIEIDVSPKNIESLDTIIITGTITDVPKYKPIKITITDPNEKIVYAPLVAIKDNGEFRKVIHPTLPSFQAGTYTIVATHEDTEVTATTQFTVTTKGIPQNTIEQPIQDSIINPPETSSEITMFADAINGSDVIKINGITNIQGSDITLVVSSPSGKVVTIAQVSPDSSGNFELEIKTGGSMWEQDGMYVITANQGTTSEHSKSVNVEIKDGLVIPEFGAIASIVLAISVFTIIIFSTKSKLGILPRY